ncbi:hypothetical protein DBADOPDK_06220 [Pseudomonas sp. MM223]|nr:hypothetical protein DBADOPDK_06220 [Pseudomonas sp. MM223]
MIEQKGRHCLESLPRTDSEHVAVAIGLLATLSSSFSVQDDLCFLHLAKLMGCRCCMALPLAVLMAWPGSG